MSTEVSGIESVLARIAQIQAGLAGTRPAIAPAVSSRPAAVNTAFRTALSAASASAGTSAASLTGTASLGGSAASLTGSAALLGGSAAPAFATATALAGVRTGQPAGSDIVASAEKYLGVPYVFGGSTPSGLDCSGLVQRAYADLGISLPRIAADQAHAGTAVPSLGQAQPGDILAFGEPAHHVTIYLGNDKMIAAPQPGDKVKIQSVYETPTSIRRVIPSAGPTGSTGPGLGSGLAVGQFPAPGLSQYASMFSQNEARYQLPRGLLAAVAQTESGGNPAAVSPAGAQGLMQLMPGTAQGLGVNPWEPAQAVQGAAQLLSKYLHTFGSVPLALAAYNAGPGAVEQYGGVPPYNETQKYVTKITGLMAGRAG
jgi:cell wall-associated NlpC family hydrolase